MNDFAKQKRLKTHGKNRGRFAGVGFCWNPDQWALGWERHPCVVKIGGQWRHHGEWHLCLGPAVVVFEDREYGELR